MKTTTKDIFLLRRLLENDIARIPDYLDTKNYLNKLTFKQYQNVIEYFSKLTEEKCLSERTIKAIINKVNFELEIVGEYEDTSIQIILYNDLNVKLNRYFEFAESYELYEVCHNIKKFIDIFNG